MNLFTIFTNVAITAISYYGKYSELTISHGQSTYASWHSRTGQNRTCSFRYHLQHLPSFHLIHKHFHILISSPRCYNVFKAAPIVAYKRSSNVSDFLIRAKLRNFTQHNQPRGSYPCEKKLSHLKIHVWRTNFIQIPLFKRNQTIARFYGQNIKISLNQCHVYIHPFYTEYIPVMYNKRCSMQRYASQRCSIKLKDKEANVIRVEDVR